MPKVYPLPWRRARAAAQTPEEEAMLVTFTHPSLDAPVRVASSFEQEPLSIEPLRMGIRSAGHEYEFVLMTAIIPDDVRKAPRRVQFILDNVAYGIVTALRSFASPPAKASISTVLLSDPDFQVLVVDDLSVVNASCDASKVTLDLAHQEISEEQFGIQITKRRLPGLYGIASS